MSNKDDFEKIKEAREQYDELITHLLEKAPEQKSEYKTLSGIPLDRVYTPADIKGTDYLKDIGFPGQYPFTRGLFPNGYRSRSFNSRQVVGIGTAEETNQRWKYLISQGMTALAVVGPYGDRDDSTSPMWEGYAGRNDLMADTLADFETLLDGIDLNKLHVHLIDYSPVTLAMFIVAAEKRGFDRKTLSGSISNSITMGLYPENKGNPSIDIVEFCTREMPLWNAFYVDVRNHRDGGLTAIQELAYAIAIGSAGIKAVMERGLDVDQFAHRISFFVSSERDLLEEVAKFRGMRRMWARLMKETFNAKNPKSWRMRCHVQTSAVALTKPQPLNNLMRSTLHALAAVLGGCQSIHVNSFDEVLATPSDLAASISLRTLQIIQHESGATNVADPLGGSYYVEFLTNKLEEEAQKIVDTIEEMGGAFKAREWMTSQMRASAYKYQKEFEEHQRIVVGLNDFIEEEDKQLEMVKSKLAKYNSNIIQKQKDRVTRVLEKRDNAKAEEAKKMLYEAYKEKVYILPPLIDAVKTYITKGEIARVREAALGELYGPEARDSDDSLLYFCPF